MPEVIKLERVSLGDLAPSIAIPFQMFVKSEIANIDSYWIKRHNQTILFYIKPTHDNDCSKSVDLWPFIKNLKKGYQMNGLYILKGTAVLEINIL